jgi:nicotinate-nucleotide adenylyltransferase
VRIGIFGGTFDPIHLGHLAAARAARECAQLDKVLFVPSATPPHRGPAVADPQQRLEMTRLAIDDEKGFEVSDVEVRRDGVSYTVDTLRQLHRMHPEDELFLIIGGDAAKLFDTWREPGEVRRLASLIIVTRPGSGAPSGTSDIVCERPTPDVSASLLRRRLAHGQPVTDMLPQAVADYVAGKGLYRDNRSIGC